MPDEKKPYYVRFLDQYRGSKRVVSLKDLNMDFRAIEEDVYKTVGNVAPPERTHFRNLIIEELK